MSSIAETEFCISVEDSVSFARLSGDYNPLHVDPLVARRTPFGGSVTHGIHLFLHALDYLASQRLFERQEPASVSATFSAPVPSNSAVRLRASMDAGTIRVAAETDGSPAFTGTIALMPAHEEWQSIEDSEFEPALAQAVTFPPSVAASTVPLKMSTARLGQLFPSLAKLGSRSWIADLLGTTQVVGMQCPGLNSIYSGFRLRRVARPPCSSTSMHYRVDGTERRFQLVRLQMVGACLAGTVETFFRPRPVAQRPMIEVAAAVPAGTFAGQRALIVGGSRGLGELTAKILAAGGAEVTITYARGKEDAERVCSEVRVLGRECSAYHLDVASGTEQPSPESLPRADFSHVYYFASPPILKNSGRWNETHFRQFTHVYVTAFAALVERTLSARRDRKAPVSFLYPSSIFVAHPAAGFAEYAVAKAAGEALCDQLHGQRGARFVKPRLPSLRTDQTNALVDIGAMDPFPAMLAVLRDLHSTGPTPSHPLPGGEG